MSEIFDDPVIIIASKTTTGAGDCQAQYQVSEGRYQILTAALSLASTYAAKASIGFKYILADSSVIAHMLTEGWAFNKNGISIPYIAEIQGPGYVYATAYFAAGGTVTLYAQIRRVRNP